MNCQAHELLRALGLEPQGPQVPSELLGAGEKMEGLSPSMGLGLEAQAQTRPRVGGNPSTPTRTSHS